MKNTGRRYDAILLLGLTLGENDQPKEELCIRAHAAAKAYLEYAGTKVIACGGVTEGHTLTEAEVMKKLLIADGVPQQDIILESESRTTMENFLNAAKIIGKGKHGRVLIVTSDYHVRRAVMTARRVGLKADGYPAVLVHDETWKHNKGKEIGYTVDLLMGWQDPGKSRPQWTYRLFDIVFGRKG